MKWIDKKFEILRSLGGGGFSDVYLVKCDEYEAALKVLKTEITLTPNEKNLNCFKNEFSILKNLNHPNIARILDFGLDEELMQYYFTSEYVEGADIYTGTEGVDVETIIRLFAQALRALEYLHSYRTFHFDLKAANVLLNKKNEVKLIDFGLASIDPKGKLMGTPSYMPPEIIRKEKPDGRADIYSLGVLWYYCLARKNPFKTGNSRLTIENQKSLIAPPPSKYNPKIPKYIDQIIARMLEKRPEKRYEYASQIIRELNLLGGLNIETETSETLLSYIPEKGRFIGRKDEIALITDAVQDISEKRSNHKTFLITGKTGTGKKRFMDEIRYCSQINDIAVEVADGHNSGDVEAWLDKIDEHLRSGESPRAFLLTSTEWLEAASFITERIKNSLSKIPAFSKNSATLVAIGVDQKSVLVGELAPLANSVIELCNFSQEELQEYVTNLTGLEEIPDFLVEEILKRTEGNPLFVTEISKSLISSGALFDTKGRWKDTSFIDLGVDFKEIFPESLKDLLLDVYYDLETNEKMVIDYLSVADRPSSSFELASWTGIEDISPIIEKLMRADILTRKTAYEYYFRNELLSGYVYEGLPPEIKEKYHDTVAEYLIKSNAETEEVVRHLGQGSNHRRAFEETFQAGCKYLNEGLGKKARELFNVANSDVSVTTLEEKIELNMKYGEAYLISQDYDNALHCFNSAEDFLLGIKDKDSNISWHVDNLIKIGGTYIKLQELDKARKSFQAGKKILKEASSDQVRKIILENWEGYLALQEGNIEEAEEIYSKAREEWKTLSKEIRANVKNNELGKVLLRKGEIERATSVLKEDLDYFKEIKDELLIARRYYDLAQAHQMKEEIEDATRYLQKVADLSRETRDIELLFCVYNELGNIFKNNSQLEESRKYYERARGLSFQSGDFKSHAAISVNIGTIEKELGNTDLAYYELSPAIIYLKNTFPKTLFDWHILIRAEIEMVEILLNRGDLEGANSALKSANDSATHLPKDDNMFFWLLCTKARYLKEKGDEENYRTIINELEVLAGSPDEKEAIHDLKSVSEADMENIYHRILEINKLINSEKSVESVFKVILKHALEISGAESAAITLKGAEGELSIAAHQNVDNAVWSADISHSFAREAILNDKIIESDNAEEDERFSSEDSIRNLHLKSVLCVPIHVKEKIIGALYLDNRNKVNVFREAPRKIIMIFTDQIGIAIDNAKRIEELSAKSVSMKNKIEEMSDQLKHYEQMMEESVHGFTTKYHYENIIGRSKPMADVLQTVDKIMDTDISVLITGESGTGKELVARALHFNSRRKNARFVTINCGAIPANLMESELFGYKAGAFTGAVQDKKGLFEEADGGTIFLDEITELDPPLQVKLLRVLQEKEFQRVGDTKPKTCDVRIISATNKDVEKALSEKMLREDLYWRICQLRLHIPPLRERREDIPLLVKHFLSGKKDEEPKTISSQLLKMLIEYNWPGNIRELENLVSVAAALSKDNVLDKTCIPENYGIYRFISQDSSTLSDVEEVSQVKIDEKNSYRPKLKWEDYEKIIYAKVYLLNDFKARKAADELHIAPTTMYNKIKLFHLDDKSNPIYKDSFKYTRGHTLKSYELPIFKAALKCAGNTASRAISKLGISQGFFYKVMKQDKPKLH